MLALSGTTVGEKCKTGSNAPQLSGSVEWTSATKSSPSLMLKLEEPAPGVGLVGVTSCGGSTQLSVSLYLYGDIASEVVAQHESAWQTWVNERFPSPIPSTT